jgi:transposase
MVGGAVDTIVERCAGIDIGKVSLKATLRVQGGQGRKTRREVRTFGTTTPELLQLREWLVNEQVSVVGMESTGVFWKPIFYLLDRSTARATAFRRCIGSIAYAVAMVTSGRSRSRSCSANAKPAAVFATRAAPPTVSSRAA